MGLREITIGRAKDCDIYLDPRCKYASSHHATIYFDGNQLMFKDTSTNGTLINNVSIKHRAVPINHGDIIMLAAQYPLSWKQIDYYFPNDQYNGGANFPKNSTIAIFPGEELPQKKQEPSSEELKKWSWGAFCLYSIWGFFNGCWWAFFIALIPFAFPIANIIFGIYGNRWSWENKQWSSYEEFKKAQSNWKTAGLVILGVNLVIIIIFLVINLSLITASL